MTKNRYKLPDPNTNFLVNLLKTQPPNDDYSYSENNQSGIISRSNSNDIRRLDMNSIGNKSPSAFSSASQSNISRGRNRGDRSPNQISRNRPYSFDSRGSLGVNKPTVGQLGGGSMRQHALSNHQKLADEENNKKDDIGAGNLSV